MIKIRATFNGPRESLGYSPGRRYTLWLRGNVIRGVDLGEQKDCPYATIESFMRNWQDVEFIAEKSRRRFWSRARAALNTLLYETPWPLPGGGYTYLAKKPGKGTRRG